MKKILTLTLVLISGLLASAQNYRPLQPFNEADCEAKTLNIKVKDQYRALCAGNAINIPVLTQYLNSIGGSAPKKLFPNAKQPDAKMKMQVEQPADITLIYRITYTANLPMQKIINTLNNLGLFEYVEPNFIQQKFYTPTDASFNSQWYVGLTKAGQAWDTWRGDTSMIIGITDSGIDTSHTDLRPNIKYNLNDPIDGIDNDQDGYTDNYRGWNMWANTGNVYDAADSHGTFVAGISSAKADNGIGIAGLGFNCTFIPVRVDDNVGNYIRAYEGVVYAADHRCKVINCSWGSKYFSNFGWDVIQYAVINKDAVVVAAAGNDNNEVPYYPASYQYVINVGGIQQNSVKSNSSSWGAYVDMVAYGSGVYSTWNPNTYTTSGGTSAAAPMVSAAAALLRSYYPSWSALKASQQIIESADPGIYGIPSNNTYNLKLGKGKLDMYKMLVDTSFVSATILNKTVRDNNDGNFYTGDTLRITGLVKNYLQPTPNLTVTVSTTSPYITLLNNTFDVPALNQNDTASNYSQPITAIIANSPANQKVEFKFTITGGGYNAVEWLVDTINRNRVNIDVGYVTMTVPSNGAIGFGGNNAVNGYGFQFQDSGPLFYNSGFLVGRAGSPNRVMDNVYAATIPNFENDWASVISARYRAIHYTSDKDAYGRFEDSNAGGNRIGTKVDHRAFGWKGANERFVILEYCIRPTTAALTNLSAGIFTDWDILQSNLNKVVTDTARKMIYAYSTEPKSIYAGVVLLTKQPANYYAFNSDGTSGSISIYDGFTTDEKLNTMSGTVERLETPTAGDVAAMLGVGPFNLAVADSMKIAVAFVAGKNLFDLQLAADSAYARYWRYIWTGVFSSEWNKAFNWNWMRIPDDTTDVTIPANPPYTPIIGNYNAFGRDFHIYTPSTIGMNDPTSKLNVKGSIYTAGATGIDATQGTVEFNGSTPQIVNGTHVAGDVKVNNPAGVTLNVGANITINGKLNIALGDLINKGTLNKQ